ncbi:gustatory receptor for sugar taste 64a-like [Toxorhynchites rutilus septentrionalis]|uniref:gustatory receptor for sugar taste 64a-like n=1 Tax=Toxorhynchites rutilus septentrionalis TaxID=329112 RepID=UPI0024798B1E|nr:gustatory receptor for sugar taste 64a-like [Toxorhynchites rutilus septentrionalis]
MTSENKPNLKLGKKILVWESNHGQRSIPSGCSAHKALAPIILFGQIFSLMPVSGYFRSSPDEINFQFKSLRFALACVMVTTMISICCLFVIHLFQRGIIGLGSAAGAIYYLVIIFAMIEFMILASNWRSIMLRWAEEEKPFLYYPYETGQGLPLASLTVRIAFVIIFMASLEDILNFVSAYKLNELHMQICPHANDFWRNFFHREHPHIVQLIPYHPALGVAIELAMRVAKITWNYSDVFIICVCLVVQRRIHQFNGRVQRLIGRDQLPREVWRELRMDFLSLSDLVGFLDAKLSRIILMSCANDMLFISVQLYNIFEPQPTLFTTIYLWYSLLFLMSRCFAMLYITSALYEASLQPLDMFRNISTSHWNLDLERLLDHVSLRCIAFSGKQFFRITRPLILAMAGTIMTYELVLLDQVAKNYNTTADCTF